MYRVNEDCVTDNRPCCTRPVSMVNHATWILAGLIAMGGALAPPSAQGQLASGRIAVGPNVQVTRGHATDSFDEVLVAADPAHADHLVGCSFIATGVGEKPAGVAVASRDGGATWDQTLLASSGDNACTFGADGVALFSTDLVTIPRNDTGPSLGAFYSADGGFHWMPATFKGAARMDDRDFIIADQSESRYRGRVYIAGTLSTKNLDGAPLGAIALYRSLDGGKTYELPAMALYDAKDTSKATHQPCNLVVLSDGTVVVLAEQLLKQDVYTTLPHRGEPNGILKILRSRDGGETLQPAVKVSDHYIDYRARETTLPGVIAVDPGSAAFKDRLYVTWADVRSGRAQVLLSYSTDKGTTWSAPQVVSDDIAGLKPGQKPNEFMPTVAVNRDGVVGVLWYDRRDNPDNTSFYVRFAASLDGGQSWMPSVRVSTAPKTAGDPKETITLIAGQFDSKGAVPTITLDQNEWIAGGHTAGLAADATGRFHPFWVDNRTGTHQVWTAVVTVTGTVSNPDTALAGLTEVTGRVAYDLSNVRYDMATHEASVDIRLRDTSAAPIMGPLRLHLRLLGSDRGVAQLVDPRTGQLAGTVVLDYTAGLASNVLQPHQLTPPQRVTVHMTHLLPFIQGDGPDDTKATFADLEARTYAAQDREPTVTVP